MKKRIVLNKPLIINCKICEKEISLYALPSHIKFSHKMTSDEYASEYGEFRKPKKGKNPTNRNLKLILCELCKKEFASVGMFTHLRDTHSITTDEYCLQYGEYRPPQLRDIEYENRLVNSETKQTCVICNKECATGQILAGHLKREHFITKREYIINHFFKGIHPTCLCGCGKKVKLTSYYPYKHEYKPGHNPNPMLGVKHTSETKMKMSIKAVKRIQLNIGKKIDTKPELDFKSVLDKFNIEYIHPCEIDLGHRMAAIDFYIPEKDMLVEIDGEYWRPKKLENLNLHILSNVISDKERECLTDLIRIRENEIGGFILCSTDKEKVFEYLSKLKDKNNNLNISYDQNVINKSFFINCLEKKGKEYLIDKIPLLLKFIKTFQLEFPYPPLEENIQDVIKKISEYDLSRIYYKENQNEFSNNVSTIGHNYLKHYFKSYWNGKYSGNHSPVEAWKNDKIMNDVIKYRIGCNNSNEIFDFSLYQIVRGIASLRITVSFFKPLLAAAIYKHYLKDTENPIVLDPCCGFGGRLLGFKSIYPNGKYIGCEPNLETYNELLNIIKDCQWNDVEIYNCKFEDFVDDHKNYDLVFTSIPYFDREIYSNNTEYNSFDDWKTQFISSIERYSGKNCYINTNKELATKLNWNNVNSYIVSNSSHFDKTNNTKKEVIVKL